MHIMKTIAIIGGGVTGVTTAYALAKRGFAVTLLERHRYAAMETSYANGGQLSASNAEVWNHRATIAKALQWMLRAMRRCWCTASHVAQAVVVRRIHRRHAALSRQHHRPRPHGGGGARAPVPVGRRGRHRV
jgi:glycine/D-amino acid oxidase-like deaminating enzyme